MTNANDRAKKVLLKMFILTSETFLILSCHVTISYRHNILKND